MDLVDLSQDINIKDFACSVTTMDDIKIPYDYRTYIVL